MSKILCGTAGWTDKTLIACKRFYPRGSSTSEARLRFYASQFPLVEVDSSYYALPSVPNSTLWAERTPEGFLFNFKAFRLFTGHQTAYRALPSDITEQMPDTEQRNLYYRDVPAELLDELWRRFLEALQPLAQAGKLGAVLFQFAPWLTSARAGRAHVEECARRMERHTVAIELRNKSWLDEKHAASTLALEREHGLVHVVMDAPLGVANRAQTVWAVTHPQLAVVRLHGRNAATWNAASAPSASARFNYDYSNDELRDLAVPIKELAKEVETTHVVFNNCFEDQGQRNARMLISMLEHAQES
jgi:uncharacterized protein YecE (DUF72 family)